MCFHLADLKDKRIQDKASAYLLLPADIHKMPETHGIVIVLDVRNNMVEVGAADKSTLRQSIIKQRRELEQRGGYRMIWAKTAANQAVSTKEDLKTRLGTAKP